MKDNKSFAKYAKLKLKTLNCIKYYNVHRAKSYRNIGIWFMILMGMRGTGKTTQWLIDSVDNWIASGEEFLYVRRYPDECKLQKGLLNPIIQNTVFIGDGLGGGRYVLEKHTIGHLVPLSVQNKYKSVDFSNVTRLIFDEAIIKQTGHRQYITNEVEELFELISTVFREKQQIEVIILGNNIDFFNPYMSYFSVPQFTGNTYIDNERGLMIEYSQDTKEYREAQEKTPLFRLTKGTAYHDYHYNNKVLVKEKVEYCKIPNNAMMMCVFYINNNTLALYSNDYSEIYVKGYKERIDSAMKYDVMRDDIPNYEYQKYFSKGAWYQALRRKYYNKTLKYNNDIALVLTDKLIEIIK